MLRRIILVALILFVTSCLITVGARVESIRVGYFPNITHAQAVIGMVEGQFQKGFDKVKIEPFLFNAGPSAMEALLAGELDIVYVGPNPAVNCYIKSEGTALKIIAGACSGGAGLVVRGDVKIKKPNDLKGKRIATPQLGNTQDVALRAYLLNHKMGYLESGGDVQIMPTSNSNMLLLFQRKEVDAAWTVEPWVSRLIVDGGGRLYLDERELWSGGRFTTAVVVASSRFIREHPDWVRRWLAIHVALSRRIQQDPAWAKRVINKEMERVTGKPMPQSVLDQAWSRLEITYDPLRGSLFKSADQAYKLGFLGNKKPDLRKIYDLSFLKKILLREGLPELK
ncbi:MAG TPA: aliphatic sulfonate ABC transporter substrate-binding protein [Bacillota bacterium]|nr:aliphatic sulfonate ABC transporter substrate-binding protein [Bacillota bacterium]